MIEQEIHWSEIEQALSDTLLFLNEFGSKDRTVEDNLEFAEFLRGRILDALHNVTCDENECGYKKRKAKMTGKAKAKC